MPLQAGDTPEALARAVGGEVVAWDASGCSMPSKGDCTALIGMNGSLKALSNLQALSGRKVHVEANKDAVSGGGKLTAKMNGSIGIWMGGSIGIWMGGTYSPIPENTTIWQKVNLAKAQSIAPNLGDGVTVAVIDTGIDLQHPAFQGTLSDPSTWRDFYSGDASPQEEGTAGKGGYGHGTNVAGIVLQIAPKAKIMPLRVLGPDGSGDALMVAQAIEWAAEKGAQVINLSLGTAENSELIQNAIEKVTAQGVLVTSSAGNSNLDRITYPAANATQAGSGDYFLSVGSVDVSDVKSSFSNYASTLEIVAPGENVYAPAPDGRMAAWSGTSMAAPMVAGGLALALGQKQALPRGEITGKMAGSAFDVYSTTANAAYKSMLGIKGRLDLAAFLENVLQN